MRDLNQRRIAAWPGLPAMLRASDGILDMLPVATFICDARGVILQYNRFAVEIWGRAPRPGQAHEAFTADCRYYTLAGELLPRSPLAEVLASGEAVRDAEVMVERHDGMRVVCSINLEPLRDTKGEMIGVVSCFLDISERERITAALEESRVLAREQEQRLAATYEHAAIGISEVDPDGAFLRVNEAVCDITGYSRDYILRHPIFTNTHPDDADPDREAFRKQVAGGLDFYSVEKRFKRPDGRVIWLSIRSSPVRTAGGRLLYLVRVMQDITERKAAERRQKLLIDELNHRVKNTLATVQSLASQTARAAPTPDAFRESFEGRLIALSKAHDQLTVRHWESADLRAMLTAALAPYGAVPERVTLRGEDILLRPRALLTLAMAFHELITNAAKYGALSVSGGRIAIAWRPEQDGGGKRVLRIGWTEEGGPAVSTPARRGFGTRLIEGSVAAELGGRARMTYAPEGLRCEIVVPLDAVIADPDRPAPDWAV